MYKCLMYFREDDRKWSLLVMGWSPQDLRVVIEPLVEKGSIERVIEVYERYYRRKEGYCIFNYNPEGGITHAPNIF